MLGAAAGPPALDLDDNLAALKVAKRGGELSAAVKGVHVWRADEVHSIDLAEFLRLVVDFSMFS